MINLNHVTKKYGTFTAVDDLNLEIKDGEIFGLLGPNGAGKSSALKMITGITDISDGSIFIDGYSIQEEAQKAKENFAFVMDTPDMFLRLKAIDYLNYVGQIYKVPVDELKKNILHYCAELDMEKELNERILSFSHGMRQKIHIIASLIHNPKTWILDEPMTGLDPASQHKIKELMRNHADDQRAVLFSTHVLETAERLCDRVGIIHKGKLLFCGTLDELRGSSDKSLEDIFLEMTAK